MQPNPFRQLNKAKFDHKLSQPQLNPNSTQPDITKVGFDTKMTLHNCGNISAVTDQFWTKL